MARGAVTGGASGRRTAIQRKALTSAPPAGGSPAAERAAPGRAPGRRPARVHRRRADPRQAHRQQADPQAGGQPAGGSPAGAPPAGRTPARGPLSPGPGRPGSDRPGNGRPASGHPAAPPGRAAPGRPVVPAGLRSRGCSSARWWPWSSACSRIFGLFSVSDLIGLGDLRRSIFLVVFSLLIGAVALWLGVSAAIRSRRTAAGRPRGCRLGDRPRQHRHPVQRACC